MIQLDIFGYNTKTDAICLKMVYYAIVTVILSCPVYKIPGFSEMRGFQSWILPVIPYGDQFFLQQSCHIDWSFFRCRAEERSADMNRGTEIYFIVMLSFPLFNYCMVHQSFRKVIHDQSCPDFLFHIFRFISMEITQSDRIFQFTEGRFDSPA